MALLFGRRPATGHPELDAFVEAGKALLADDSFIADSRFKPLKKQAESVVKNIRTLINLNTLAPFAKQNKYSAEKIVEALKFYDEFDRHVEAHNNAFVKKHLESDKTYLDEILKPIDKNIRLDEEQRTVVLRDQDYTLVVAGAGSGKTTTVAAKVRYLVEKQEVDPSRILIVSFTNKATDELRDRINDVLKIPARISTFHSIGYDLIKKSDEAVRRKVVENGYMFDVLRKYFAERLQDEPLRKKLVLFFASYLNPPFDEERRKKYQEMLATNNFTSMKTDIAFKTALEEYKENLAKNKHISIKEERMRSYEEVQIANFLYVNGIDYEYEPVYKYRIANSLKPYTPDFVLRQGDLEVYLEHFGISESGKNSRFNQKELEDYKKHVNDKVLLHRKHGTKLIFTFSSYNDGRDKISHLSEKLRRAGFHFNLRSQEEVYERLIKNSENTYYYRFITLMTDFLQRFETNNFKEGTFDRFMDDSKDERSKLFLSIAKRCYRTYENALSESNSIDFSGMINQAVDLLDTYIKEGTKLPFDYIFIDEYQDISLQRYDLAERLSKASNAKIIAVGDDWQSIFRFAGADISLFTHFSEKVGGRADLLKITNTYRNSQELIDTAGTFVMKNTEQIAKELHSDKHIEQPICVMSYDDSPRTSQEVKNGEDGPLMRSFKKIGEALDRIVEENGEEQKVLLIGRYNFDGRNLSHYGDSMFTFPNSGDFSHPIYIKHPKLKIEFLTAHSSKGLTYDNVILLNARDAVLGFPSQIEDDPLMKFVIKNDESIDYADERRLFYVAMTRTKNRVYMIVPKLHPSKFVLEIMNNNPAVSLTGEELDPQESSIIKQKCPMCGYPLQHRASRILKNEEIWVCSNDPELCGYVTNNLESGKMGITKCPHCEDGYLICKHRNETLPNGERKRTIFMGCTNYKPDGTGCNYSINPSTFSTSLENLAIRKGTRGLQLKDLYYCDMPFRDLVSHVISLIKTGEGASFHFGTGSIAEFLTGIEKPSFISFHLTGFPEFGLLDSKYTKRIMYLISKMCKARIIRKQKEKEFSYLTVCKEQPTESELIDLYELMRKDQQS